MTTIDPFYRDGRIYDLMHDDFVSDHHFYISMAKQLGGPILEVACGTGRITIPIAEAGLEIWGLDISQGMLSEARKKSIERNLNINWVLSDCRKFELNKKFKFIFIPFNSMQHLHDRQSLESFFNCVKQHLDVNGRFLVDIFNPNIQLLARDRTVRTHVFDMVDPDTGKPSNIEETIDYDIANQVNRVKWFYSIEGKPDFRVDELHMRCFFPEEINQLLYYNGFEVVEKFGSFDRSPFTSNSPKQLLLLKRRGE